MPKRLAQIVVLLFASLTMLGAGDPSTRFDKLGHKLMCTCGCAEILLECNHMGCPDSPGLITALNAHLQGTESDHDILTWFADKYGPTVLAAPIRGGFDLVAWIVPFAVVALGIVGIFWLLRHWRDRHHQAVALASSGNAAPLPPLSDLRDRIRRETDFEL